MCTLTAGFANSQPCISSLFVRRRFPFSPFLKPRRPLSLSKPRLLAVAGVHTPILVPLPFLLAIARALVHPPPVRYIAGRLGKMVRGAATRVPSAPCGPIGAAGAVHVRSGLVIALEQQLDEVAQYKVLEPRAVPQSEKL